jgi:imidazolonepropionase-like amidohydrolase
VAGGMSTMQALMASTRTAAEAIGVLDRVGTLEPGKEADVLVVEANPLDNVGNLRDVVAVFKAGQRVVGA